MNQCVCSLWCIFWFPVPLPGFVALGDLVGGRKDIHPEVHFRIELWRVSVVRFAVARFSVQDHLKRITCYQVGLF